MRFDKTMLATMAAHGNSISVGLCQGYSAVLIPQLLEGSMHVSGEQISWIASLGVISNPLGAILAGICMEMWGRKTTIRIANLPYCVGWILLAMADNIVKLYIGRFIAGVAVGMSTASYVYVAEISSSQQRGFLSAMGPILVSLGVLLVYILGYLLPWEQVAAVCTITSVASFLVMNWVPESPAWLFSRARPAEAMQSLMWLRGNTEDVHKEIVEFTPDKLTHWRSMCSPSVMKPAVILVLLFVFQEGSGIYIILYYAVTLLQQVGTGFNEYVASIAVAMMRLVMAIFGAVLINNYGRTSLVILSGLGMAVSMGLCGTYEHIYGAIEHSHRPFAWVPLLSVLLHVCVSMVGFLQIPWILTGELFPLKARGIAGGIVSAIAHLLIFTSVKTFPDLLEHLGMDGTLWLFAAAALTGAIYCALFLPETKGKTLTEIEQHFNKKQAEKTGKISNINICVVEVAGIENGCKTNFESYIRTL